MGAGRGVTDDIAGDDARYWAFISYSHRDAAFGRRLHRRLENYALPRRLVGRETAQGAVPKKLAPIFRDREELPAAHDLSTEVRAALKASRSLIVVCSPSSAASQWVGREIEVFRELHPGRPILAAVRDGEPADCFPKALHGIGPGGVPIEPLAADFRRGRDGEQLGLLKLVAGIIGLGLDELIQRDAHRRNQRVTAVTAGALAAVIVMGVLTGYALNARSEADRQRGEAEGLVEYMLTDLRDKLKGVGRLDVMTAVNERALRYYSDQDLEKLPAVSLERRARILHAMGEDDETRGDDKAALAKFLEARRTTAALLAAAPADPDRIFDHAQSEFYIGLFYYMRHRNSDAQTSFLAYKKLADRLASTAPGDPRSDQEVGFADGNLCSNALKLPNKSTVAIQLCTVALENMDRAVRRSGPTDAMQRNLANRHSWLASAYLASGDQNRAESQILIEDRILDDLLRKDPKNALNKHLWVSLQRQSAWMEAQMGHKDLANARLARAAAVLDEMIRYESRNSTWRDLRSRIDKDLAEISALKQKGEKQ